MIILMFVVESKKEWLNLTRCINRSRCKRISGEVHAFVEGTTAVELRVFDGA